MQKFIIGWVKFKPGHSANFLDAMKEHATATRQEDGCVFFDVGVSLEAPDTAIFVECFETAEAHQRHLETPRMKAVMAHVSDMVVSGRFENVLSDDVVSDRM